MQKLCDLAAKKTYTIFATQISKHGVVVQLVRIPACHAGGREFESRPYRQDKESIVLHYTLFFVGTSFVDLRECTICMGAVRHRMLRFRKDAIPFGACNQLIQSK